MIQADAAEVLGCSEAHVSRMASGERRPSPELMLRIERHFRWPVAEQLRAVGSGEFGDQFKDKVERVVKRA